MIKRCISRTCYIIERLLKIVRINLLSKLYAQTHKDRQYWLFIIS